MTHALPANMREEDRRTLEYYRVRFLGDKVFTVSDEYEFIRVLLPKGWRILWSDWTLRDEKGRERGYTRCKPDPMTGWVYFYLTTRFSCRADETSYRKTGAVGAIVTDCGETIHTTKPVQQKEEETLYCQFLERVIGAGERWLDEHYPQWRDPAAYWD